MSATNFKRYFKRKGCFLTILLGISITSFFIFYYSTFRNRPLTTEETLAVQVTQMNDILPQRIERDIVFDSVSVNARRLHFFYSLEGFEEEEEFSDALRDSLYYLAEQRVRCEIWSPGYMKNVHVTFHYFIQDRARFFSFTRAPSPCSE
ncbi:hypothetical protein QLX67_07735 [Balneolaceae bacterium ANBcel3]|nr:hypothetical protein [Balneolaceae bacterium ANBcel3]